MTNAFTWLAIIAVAWIIRELIVSFWNWKRIRKLDHVMRVERTRSQFATARNSLMHLVLKEQIDPNSATFKTIYQLHTVFMRSPDKYPELSAAVRHALYSNGKKPNEAVLAEKDNWNDAIRKNIIETSEAMAQVLVDYSFWFWILDHIARRPWLAKPIASMLLGLKRRLELVLQRTNPDIWEIKRAQVVIHKMAAA
jgi:hypothetical protein